MTSDGSSYMASRPAPAHLTAADAEKDNVAVVHRIQLGADEGSAPSASTVRFPRPENVWMSRDVDRADWAAFTKHLFPRRRPGVNGSSATDNNGDEHKDDKPDDNKTADETTRRQRLIDIVAEWNRGFFEPRGLGILAQFGDDVEASPDGEGDVTETTANGDSSKQPNRGYGLKLGNSLLGVSMGPQSHGYGLRLGGVLLGVRVDKDQDGKDDKDAGDGDVKDK